MQETWEMGVQSLGMEMATHSSILAWKIPWKEEPGGLQSVGSQRVGHHWVTKQQQSPLLSPYSRACAVQQEKPLQWEAFTLKWRVAPTHHNYRKPACSDEDSRQSINKQIIFKRLRLITYGDVVVGIPVELLQTLKDDAVKVLHSRCQQIWKTQQWPQDWKRSVFIPIPKKGNAKECSNYRTMAFILHASKVMFKIIQAKLQQYMNHELPDVQAGFRKGRGTRDQIANIRWIIEKAREFQKNIYFCFIDYAKAFNCVDHNILWKILQEMGIPDHLSCLLRNLYAIQEATVRTGHGKTDWSQMGKGVCQGCIVTLLI